MDKATKCQLESRGCSSFDVYQYCSDNPFHILSHVACERQCAAIGFYDNKRDLLLNVIGNTAMFIPSGIILPLIYKNLNSFWKVVATGTMISLCIEIIQLPFSVRASDVDDLILNTLGVAIGYGIYAAVKHLRR